MKIIEDIIEMQRYVTQLRWEGKIIGFVPTMGALHKGHLSLMEHAKNESDHVVVSIFVNPAQFGPKEDYKEYPRDMEGDTEKIAYVGVDTLFTPSVSAIYPEGYRTYIEVKDLSDVMCGRARPGHLRGVATVVLKLFNIVKPHKAFFGQKDFQQTVIIKKMVEDLNSDVDVVVLPTVREEDGLAMSSRNQYLGPEERKSATVLYRSLEEARLLFNKGERSAELLRYTIIKIFKSEPSVLLEYVAIVNPKTLEEVKEAEEGTVIALAARIGKTRLIDNIVL
ncbi:MAG: pantoate--beta-alanine ligase [Nitrospirae bacterium RIFCSPLOW2_12_42_9]|nr:MAG: pantoate--beta-alanine ligase [Nitrospirae bacterium RIFCSPHIGHO2_02_FULL_42_12]OGW63052.1 MAG: pantoate--beta-alanine ligase [Nitrospirae bacterium RIFCSPLOW2_12_42_9]